MEPSAKASRQSALLILGAMFAFSLTAVFTREAGASVLGVAAWRAVFVALGFGALALVREGGVSALRPDAQTLRLGALLGGALALASATYVGGYALTTVANTIFLHNLAPLAVFPLAWWAFKERPSPAALTGAALALVGVPLLSGVSLLAVAKFANPRFLMGDLLAFISAIGYAGVLVATRATRRAGTPIAGTLFVAWSVAAALLLALALIFGQLAVPWGSLPWILGLALISTNVAFYLLNLGMRQVGAGTASVLAMAEVVFATLIGIALYGEQLSPLGWVGGGLAALGVAYAMTQEGERDSAAPEGALLDEALLRSRGLRLGLSLALLNGGALFWLLFGSVTAPLLAWVGLVTLARFGPAAAATALEGRFRRALQLVGAGVGGLAVAGVLYRGGWEGGAAEPAVLVLALGVAAADAALARGEEEAARDPALGLRGALLLLALGEAFGLAGHPGGRWLVGGAAILAGLTGVGVAVAATRGRAGPLDQSPELSPLESRLARLLRPRALGELAFVALLMGGLHAVPAGSVGIVERFGRPLVEPVGPGLAVRLPPPIEQLTVVDVARVRRAVVLTPDTPVLCGDQSMIALDVTLNYTVADPAAFAFAATDPEAALVALSRAALTAAVARRSQDEVLTTGRFALEERVAATTQAASEATGLGVAVSGVQLRGAAVPAPVLSALLDVISADEERQTRINRAEADAADRLPRARGRAQEILAVAEGNALKRQARAEADAALFDALRSGGATGLTTARLRWELVEETLGPARLVVAPADVSVWLAGQGPAIPLELAGDKTSQGRSRP